MKDVMTETTKKTETPDEQVFTIQKIFVKDVSFESPNAPNIFLEKDWQPDVNLNLQSTSRPLDDSVYEVTLSITVTAKSNEETTAYLAEVQYSGIFVLNNFADEDKTYMLGSYCPNLLFPYIRESISDLVTKGGFPQLLLAPVNFDSLLQQKLQQEQEQQKKEGATA